MLDMQVTQTGDWKKAKKLTDPMYWLAAIRAARPITLRMIGDEYVKQTRAAILGGNADGPGLAETTVARKGHGLPWYDYGDIANALRVVNLGNGRYLAGIPAGEENRRGEDMPIIAMSLEVGTVDIPPRRIFEPIAMKLARNKAVIGKAIEVGIMIGMR